MKLNLSYTENTFVILTLANSVEFEGEMKLRLSAAASSNRSMKIPSPMYVGMFAGANKPKPFQRKRPNLSYLPSGKLPTLHDMRTKALDLHRGSYRPCPQGESRRVEIALQHIYEGHNTFNLLNVRGASSIANQFRSGSVLLVTDEALVFKARRDSDSRVEFFYDDIQDWNAVDNDNFRMNDSGIEVILGNGETVFFGVPFVRDVKHTIEYFWNCHKVANGRAKEVKLGSTHGRPIVSVHTLSGEIPPPESPVGQTDVVDQDGIVVRPGGRIAPRRASMTSGIISNSEPKTVPPENREVKRHWHKVVLHQGWLLKQGGVGVGNNKAWIKRYFVLYKTSQGHFLVYYSDFTECPMYTSEKHHRNIVDLAKSTFIRPGSNKADNPDTPPYCFDIVTTEREWTLCAESQENVQRWLKLLTRAVDEDVAILPDEELVFKVKPKLDPLQVLPSTDYSTSLKVSAQGISVTTPDPNGKDGSERENYFWVYTDFYKWSLMCPDGKLALLVNVFADSSFSRRYEYVFRTKDAHRLATAIEYFIEKFMSVMHIRLETTEGAFDGNHEQLHSNGAEGKKAGSGLHEVAVEDIGNNYSEEIDLLGLEITDAPITPTNIHSSNPFGDDPFGSSPPPSKPPVPAANSTTQVLDLFGTSVPAAPPASKSVDLFGDDPFHSDDPFGSTNFSSGPKIAPPLTPQQIGQHKLWLVTFLGQQVGPIYDDGTVKVQAKIEIKESQCRLTLNYSNIGISDINDLKAVISDPAGLLRFEAAAIPTTLRSKAQENQVVMMECMRPAHPGPKFTVSYTDPEFGTRSNEIDLPILVTSFNDPLTLVAQDFMAKWQALGGAGKESVETFKVNSAIVPANIKDAMTKVTFILNFMICCYF